MLKSGFSSPTAIPAIITFSMQNLIESGTSFMLKKTGQIDSLDWSETDIPSVFMENVKPFPLSTNRPSFVFKKS